MQYATDSVLFCSVHLCQVSRGFERVATLVGGSSGAGHVDGHVQSAKMASPEGLCMTYDGCILVSDAPNNVVRVVSAPHCPGAVLVLFCCVHPELCPES